MLNRGTLVKKIGEGVARICVIKEWKKRKGDKRSQRGSRLRGKLMGTAKYPQALNHQIYLRIPC